jgi:hypothetical protein
MVRSQVNRRIMYYLSPQTPFKLQMLLSDPAAMQGCETLELTRWQGPVKDQFIHTATPIPERIKGKENYISLTLSRQIPKKVRLSSIAPNNITPVPTHGRYSKTIQLDELDFLYQLCFAIHKCKIQSHIYPSNFSGAGMKMIRLWKDWFTQGNVQGNPTGSGSGPKLFSKLIWTDPAFEIGFVLSARKAVLPEPYNGYFARSHFPSQLFQIDVDEVVIRDNYLLALFEGFTT